MPKVGMEAIRKKQLIEATISSIHERGFSDITIRMISQKAGVSSGIVHHYFQDKNDLLQATMRKMLEDLRLSVLHHLEKATSPEERIEALISAYMDVHLFEPETVSAWLAFWAHVPHSERLKRLQRVYEQRQMSTFRHALKSLLPLDQADKAARGLVALIDGLWIRTSLQEKEIDCEEAREIVQQYYEMLLHKNNNSKLG
ncbi:choline-responsive transcriptional repressor BetI [Kiloniella sp.]|uniref:choline-binding transcriptional repressor BetI n=1 Tax=Kiloniella sp. TaxID=1938587 RepID=UPI003B02E614